MLSPITRSDNNPKDPMMTTVYTESTTPTATPYVTVLRPAIARLLDELRRRWYAADQTAFQASHRALATAIGLASAGHIPAMMRRLEDDGHIARYLDEDDALWIIVQEADSTAGSPLDPDRDHLPIPRPDPADSTAGSPLDPDRDHPTAESGRGGLSQRVLARWNGAQRSHGQEGDPAAGSGALHGIHDLDQQQQHPKTADVADSSRTRVSHSATSSSRRQPRPRDQAAWAAQGVNHTLLPDILAARPDATPQRYSQVVARLVGKGLDERKARGIVIKAWRCGEYVPEEGALVERTAEHPDAKPIDVERYTSGSYAGLFKRGSDLSGLDDAREAAA